MAKNLWIETDYYDNFKCKCEKCKRCCCSGWLIPVSKKEYYKLLTLPCSKKLCDKIESCFVEPDFVTEERYRIIAPNYLGNCPMLDEDGLCMIHSELGPDALSLICKTYPRSLKKVNNNLQANCSNSCEAVVELLLKQDKLNFKQVERDDEPNIVIETELDAYDLSIKFKEMIQDRNVPLNKRIGMICNYLNGDDKDSVDSLSALKQMHDFVKTVSIDSQIYDDFISGLDQRYSLDENGLKQFKDDELLFETHYPKWMIYFENVLVNHLYYMNVPYVDERIKKQDCTEGLCLLYGLMKLICSCFTINDYSLDNLACVISDIFHLVEHTSFYYNAHVLIKEETTQLNI